MPCYYPLNTYLNKFGEIVWNSKAGLHPYPLPCGNCLGCRKRRSEDWALRCFHESLGYEHNSFLTLTYDDEHLPKDMSLDRSHVQKFIKRFRQHLVRHHPDVKIRYFACGEYGEKYGRPHYHIVVFGYDFPDKYIFSYRNNNYLYRSEELEKLWPFGQSSIGVASMATMRYCVKYAVKAQFDKEKFPNLVPPFVQMSTRPAIGHDYSVKYKKEMFNHEYVVSNGTKFAVPRAYEKKYSDEEKEELKDRRAARYENRVKVNLYRKQEIQKVKQLQSRYSGDDFGE